MIPEELKEGERVYLTINVKGHAYKDIGTLRHDEEGVIGIVFDGGDGSIVTKVKTEWGVSYPITNCCRPLTDMNSQQEDDDEDDETMFCDSCGGSGIDKYDGVTCSCLECDGTGYQYPV